jgi:hypothetical protein
LKRRRASSLIELLIIMSACSLVLTLSAALLHRAMHIQSRSRAYVDAERSATRLSHQFREDVHKALAHRAGEAPVDGDALLQLTHPGNEEVQYVAMDGTVSRTLMREAEVVSREEYAFPSAVKANVQQQEAPTRLVLVVTTNPADALNRTDSRRIEPGFSPVSLQAEAVLGRDLRFLRRSDEEEVQR